MNGPLSSAGTGSFTFSLTAISDSGKIPGKAQTDLQGVEFSDLIDQQSALPGLLEELKGLLPEQDFSQIEAFINGGNALPPAAESGGEFSLFLGAVPFPITANLSGVRMAGDALPPTVKLPLPATGGSVLTAMAPGTTNLPEVAMDTIRALTGGKEPVTAELLQIDLESVVRARGTALQESASAVPVNPLSVLKSVEAAASLRTGSPSTLQLDTPFATRGWEQGVGDRIMWMLGNSLQGASLRINPAHLGPIEIQISMHQDQTTVSFTAQHAVVRDALEASIPRLREMFQENNLQLGNVDVGQRGNSEQRAAGGGAGGNGDDGTGDNFKRPGYAAGEAQEQTLLGSAIDGLLDDYA